MGTITIINTTPYDKKPIPEVNKEYHAFDDGKINPSRHYIAKIVEVIPFKKIDVVTLCDWRDEVDECNWLYAPETDYFVKAEFAKEAQYFVRTVDGGWFSIGWFGARLDVDGKLYKNMVERWKETK